MLGIYLLVLCVCGGGLVYLQFSLQHWIFCDTVSSQKGLVFVHYFDVHCLLQSGYWTHTRANSFSPDFCCISILCSGAAFLNKQALMLQPLFSSVAMTARISARDGKSHGLGNEFIMTKVVCKKHTSGVFTPKAADVYVSFCLFLHTGFSCLCACVCSYVCTTKRPGAEQTFCSWQQWAPYPACMVHGCESELH